jgi:insertion element IS1 protein InsB
LLADSTLMTKPLLTCPKCGSQDINKNGTTRHGNQNDKCRDCGRQFVENPKWKRISDDTKSTIERMLLEKIPLTGIARSLQISESWLQQFVNADYATVPQSAQVQPKARKRLTVQIDELWSFVDDNGNEQWVWLALDAETRERVGCFVGDRSGESAKALWQSLPPLYRHCVVCDTDFWVSYPVALPSSRHRPVDKGSGLTSYIERFNNTLRQRVSRLVRKTLSFSKKLDNPISAIWNFIHNYNEQRSSLVA